MSHRFSLAAAAAAILLLSGPAMARAPFVMSGVHFKSECLPADIVWLAGQPTCPASKEVVGKAQSIKLGAINVLGKQKSTDCKGEALSAMGKTPAPGNVVDAKDRAAYLVAKSKAKLKSLAAQQERNAIADEVQAPVRRDGGIRRR